MSIVRDARELREEFDRGFAARPEAIARTSVDLIALRLAGEPYAIEMADIAAINIDSTVTAVPSPLPEFLGVASLRGEVTPVYDLGLLLGLGPAAGRWLVLDASRTFAFGFSDFAGHLRVDTAELSARDLAGDDRLSQIVHAAGTAWPVISISSLRDSLEQRVLRTISRKE